MSMSLISENLQAAIERLRPDLQTLLGGDYAPFATQLDALLAGGNDDQVLELFRTYPTAFERLQDVLAQQEAELEMTRGGLGVYGYPITEQFVGREGRLVQYFQRARFELHPELTAGLRVQLTPLGRALCRVSVVRREASRGSPGLQ